MTGGIEDGPRDLAVMGVNHRTAPIQIRERFHLGAEGVRRALEETSSLATVRGSVILSTCNRVELYLSSTGLDEALAAVEGLLAERSSLPLAEARDYLYVRRGRGAVEHLHRVVAGLDSLVPGEAEIQGQVGNAYKVARLLAGGEVDPLLHRLFQEALSAGGEVRAETAVGEGSASVPSAAVDLARKVYGELAGRHAMVVGAGAMGRLTMECLAAEGVRHAAVASRTLERARALADESGADPVAMDSLSEVLDGIDILVTCTASDRPVLRETDLAERGRDRSRPLVVLDIAVPRDVEPGADRLPAVFLYNIDDLQRVVEGAEQSRLEEVPRAEEILEESVDAYCRWVRSRQAVPMIRELRGRAREVRDRTLEDLFSDLDRGDGSDGLDPEQRRMVRDAARKLVNRLIHEPTVALRDAAAEPGGGRYLEAMRRLFDLDSRVEAAYDHGGDETMTSGTDESEDGDDG